MRSTRRLLLAIGEAVKTRSTHRTNAISAPQVRHVNRCETAENRGREGVCGGTVLRTENRSFQTEILSGTATDQPRRPIRGSIDSRARMDSPSLSLDPA